MGSYDDRALQEYVTTVGMKLAQVSERPNLPWHFTVVDVPAINAFALPGGYIYITRGILPFLDDESQLAGVLGHEIGHVTARHAASQYSKSTLAQVGLLATAIFAPGGAAVAQAGGTGLGLLFLKNGRDDEAQSDELGVRYASRAGWDPAGDPADADDAWPHRRDERQQRHPELAADASAARRSRAARAGGGPRGRNSARRRRSSRPITTATSSASTASSGATTPSRASCAAAASCTRACASRSISRRDGTFKNGQTQVVAKEPDGQLADGARADAGVRRDARSTTWRSSRCRTPGSGRSTAARRRSTACEAYLGTYVGALQNFGRVQAARAARRATTATCISSPASRR